MTKEEKIKEVYESFGFNWNECEKYISNEGILVLPTPDLKYSLKGYENLIEDEGKWSSFGNGGLKLLPGLLKGLFNNNGWIKIESENLILPINGTEVHFYNSFTNENGFKTEYHKGIFNAALGFTSYYDSENYKINEVTHYQPIEKPKPPLY